MGIVPRACHCHSDSLHDEPRFTKPIRDRPLVFLRLSVKMGRQFYPDQYKLRFSRWAYGSGKAGG
jgi:hypothetical protein